MKKPFKDLFLDPKKLLSDQKYLLSNKIGGSDKWLLDYHGKKFRLPQRPEYYPEADFLEWHWDQVFKRERRYL